MASLETVVVVGASLAGLRAVEALRRLGYERRLVLVGAESHLPYDRPPLSKEVLAGKWLPERTELRQEDSYAELALDLRLGRRAASLDLDHRHVELDDGERLRFDGLLIATGCTPRVLPGTPPLAGIHTLRTLDDCLTIRAELERGPRVAVVGAGFIGAEVAATCRQRGLEVTVIEALPVPLGRVLGEDMGQVCAGLHRDHGVDLKLGVGVAGFDGRQRVERVRLSDGTNLDTDLVVVGIGVAPETAWLAGSGLVVEDGVVCDATCATQAPGVVAAGDVARWYNPLFDEVMRIEHWTNAIDQGEAAAARLLVEDGAAAKPFRPVPFFWSDQYDVKIQYAGRTKPGDEMRIVHGSPAERRFVALYGRAGHLVAVLGFNRPGLVVRYQRMIEERASFEAAIARATASG